MRGKERRGGEERRWGEEIDVAGAESCLSESLVISIHTCTHGHMHTQVLQALSEEGVIKLPMHTWTYMYAYTGAASALRGRCDQAAWEDPAE